MSSNNDSVTQKLVDFIKIKNLQPEDQLPTHAELCKRLKVGIRPLREALSVLSQQGFIETRRRGGTILTKPCVKVLSDPLAWQLEQKGFTFEDMVRARAAVESAVVAEAAKARKTKDLLAILSAIEDLEAICSPNKDAENADEAFHLAILNATHNPVMSIFGQLIDGQFKRKHPGKFYKSAERMSESITEHRAIYHSIEKQKPEVAQKLMYKHIMYMLDGEKQKR
jgi:GntR family transcriptional repressor for pyruvate dehydrogenase complex